MNLTRRPQAKDISDEAILAAVAAERERHGRGVPATLWDVQERLGAFPPKVVQAKLRAMVRKGKLRGCVCGCRGDFEAVA